MILAVAVESNDKSSPVSERFGRGAGFFIVDTDSGDMDFLDNSSSVARAHGAGVQAAKLIAESGAEAVIVGHIGPGAFYTLEAAGLKVYSDYTGDLQKAIEDFKSGQLNYVKAPDVSGHWR